MRTGNKMADIDLPFTNRENFNNLLISNKKNIKDKLGVELSIIDNKLHLNGDSFNIEYITHFIKDLISLVEQGEEITQEELEKIISIIPNEDKDKLKTITKSSVLSPFNRKKVVPKTYNQHLYIKEMIKNDIVFSIGPAGTGKTYLAMAFALSALSRKEVKRIILTRPVVEAGEKLGFLPGDIPQKVNPYLRPLYDAIFDLLDPVKARMFLEDETIEIAPLAYMRGRTLNDAFVILDEAQNTTHPQMKMFLTRFGFNSKAVITGDITQIDLAKNQKSGLIEASKILKGIKGLSFLYFTEKDVVRHRLVKEIIKAYEKHEYKK
jgi:phosphate starvation-inducible PhoH-like protein